MRDMKDSGIEWIGAIPNTWNLTKTRRLFKTNKEIVGEQADKYERLALTLSGVIKRSKTDTDGLQPEKFESYQILKENELVFKMIDLENVSTSRVGLSHYTGLVSPAYIVLKNDKTDNRYAYYWFMSMYFNEVFNHLGGTGVRSSLNASDMLALPIPNISDFEQKAISDYLDLVCSHIASAISRQEAIIEKLKEYKLSVITEAVTKGLNSSAEFKDTNVEWLGRIPAHWSLYRVADLYYQTNERGNEDLPILTVSINSGISDRELEDDEQDRVFARSDDRTKYKRVIPGDLAYNMMRAWQGAFGAVRVNGMVSPAYITCRPKDDVDIDTRYIEYLFRSSMAIEEMHRHSHGIADFRLRLYWPEFKNIKLCLPPIGEQSNIADYIDKTTIAIDTEITRIQNIVDKLNDYKKSLIYEVVTGKKEIGSL